MNKEDMVAEGKTKIILKSEKQGHVIIRSKDDITKNDNPDETKVMTNKAVYSNTTTCAVFSLLKAAGIPVAFEERISDTEFQATECQMIMLEVIARRYGVGGYIKRFPDLEKKDETPHRFERLVFELFLKTTGGNVKDKNGNIRGKMPLDKSSGRPIDDPLIINPNDRIWELKHPKIPTWEAESNLHMLVLRDLILPEDVTVDQIEELTRKTFLVLEGAWAKFNCRLIDFKIEFGIDPWGKLVVADVIDNDSWRLRTNDWRELSKQLFRDNVAMDNIANKYALVANLATSLPLVKSPIIYMHQQYKSEEENKG